jgi:mRNA interferase MazF
MSQIPLPQSEESLPTNSERRIINQGDIFWVQLADQSGSESGIPHPYVIVQDNLFNHSRVNTVITCALTSNLKRSGYAGNVLLNAGEANLLKQSVVEVSKLTTLDKSQLGDYIGSLSQDRIDEILAGIRFQQLSFFNR